MAVAAIFSKRLKLKEDCRKGSEGLVVFIAWGYNNKKS
jgi:hypothetical protein